MRESYTMFEQKKNIRRRISGFMAVVMAVTAMGTYTYLQSREVAAKDTLDSIVKVVGRITPNDPYVVLEVTPGYAPYVVSLNGLDGTVYSVSGNQLMGKLGYYVSGSEPIRDDIRKALNDTVSENVVNTSGSGYKEPEFTYFRSSVSDSNMRHELTDEMFSVLDKQGILNNSRMGRSILETDNYFERNDIKHYNIYKEKHEGDVVWKDNERYIIDDDNYDFLGYERLDRIYKERDEKSTSYYEDGSAFIDRVKGSMIRNEEDEENSANNPADYILHYDYDNSMSDNNIGYDFIRDYIARREALDELTGDAFRYISDSVRNTAGESAAAGDFEPGLINAKNDEIADVIAVFKPSEEEAGSGYVISSVDGNLTPGEYGNNTPVYIKDGNRYYYAKTFGELGLSSNKVTGRNSISDRDYSVIEEIHLMKPAASAADSEILIQNTGEPDEEPDTMAEADGLSEEDGSSSEQEESVNEIIDISITDDLINNDREQDVSGNTVSKNETEEADDETDYYVLEFEYAPKIINEQAYNIVSFYGASSDDGAQYLVDEADPLLTVMSGKGCIEAIDKAAFVDFFIYDYVKGKGNYTWQAQDYDRNYDPTDLSNVVRIRGSKIYYKLEFTNNEWFKQYTLDRNPGKECDDLKVIVNTVPVTKLTYKNVTDAKMTAVISGSSRYTLYDYTSDWDRERFPVPDFDVYIKGKCDFDQDIYKKLIERASIENIASVADHSIIDGSYGNRERYDTLARRYVSALMLDAPDKYFDAISNLNLTNDTDNREPSQTPNTTTLNGNYDHFVNRNIYIYNMKTPNQKNGVSQNILNPYFYTLNETGTTIKGFDTKEISGDTENGILGGFEEVLLDIQNENLFRETDNANGERNLLPTDITEATVFRYIIGYSEKREESHKGKMRILEVEPTPNFNLQVNDSGQSVNEYWNTNTSTVKSTTSYRNGTFGTDDGKMYYQNDRRNPIVDQKDTRIELTRMSISEFIGHIEDLNAEYDMIYFGMNTTGFETVKATQEDVNKGRAEYKDEMIPAYNDDNMRGLVYSNIGDYVYMKGNTLGNSPYDYRLDDTGSPSIIEGSAINQNDMKYRARYAGFDISAEDVKRLKDFIDAGYPVVLDDGFFTSTTDINNRVVNTKKIDTVSYMYQFVNSVKDKKNVFTLSNMNKKLFNWYMNLSKPELKMSGDAATAMNQLVYINLSPVDNYYHATYDFTISNKGAASSDSTYNAALYIDINADGKYSHTQEGIKLTEIRTKDGQLITGSEDASGNVIYQLRTGVEYVANCQLAASFEGVVPWRFEITQNDNTRRRANATGYYQINRNELTPIKVLQLTKAGNTYGGSTWNMETTSTNGSKFDQLLNDHNIVKYDVNIKAYSAKDFDDLKFLPQAQRTEANKTKETYLSELENYDMLVMGFADCYFAPENRNAILAIQEYIADGNSVLFSHDCASYVNYVNGSTQYRSYEIGWWGGPTGNIVTRDVDNGGWGYNWGYNFNRYIRNLVGMDRYNILGSTDWDSDNWDGILDTTEWKDILDDSIVHNYDKAYYPRKGIRNEDGEVVDGVIAGSDYQGSMGPYLQNQGYSWFGLNNKRAYHNSNGSGKSLKYRYVKGFYGDVSDGQENSPAKYNVTRVNEGQITKYPYNLPATFTVATTHGQYYQLDFTADDDMDGETDIVVWYCIGDSINKTHDKDMYELTINDVRNNYYIYNKGSVTYTGVGHSSVIDGSGNPVGSDDELKLFINTLIACYQQGAHEPTLKIVENYDNNSRSIDNIYLSYDKSYDDSTYDTNGVLDNNVDVYFSTEKASLVQNAAFIDHEVNAKFYYEVASTEAGAVELVDGAGNKFYGLEITPIEFKHQDPSGNEIGEIADMNALLDKVVYKAKIPVINQNSDVMWNPYGTPGTTVSSNSLNARRILVVTTDKTTNTKTGKSKEKSNVKAVSLVRAQMFMLE